MVVGADWLDAFSCLTWASFRCKSFQRLSCADLSCVELNAHGDMPYNFVP